MSSVVKNNGYIFMSFLNQNLLLDAPDSSITSHLGAYNSQTGLFGPLNSAYANFGYSGPTYDWEFFAAPEGEYFLAQATAAGLPSGMFVWNGTFFVPLFNSTKNSTLIGRHWEFFSISGGSFCVLAVDGGAGVSSHSEVYKFSQGVWSFFQNITSLGARDVVYFTANSNNYLVFAENAASGSTQSQILKWTNNQFTQISSITTSGCRDMLIFYIGADVFLAIANQNNGTFTLPSQVWKWNINTESFTTLVASISSINNTISWSYGTIEDDNYLFLSANSNSMLYRLTLD